MKIECTLKREGGTKAEIGGIEYHFEPLDDGAHVALVENAAHQDRFLSIAEAYKLYRGNLEPKGKPTVLTPIVVSDPTDLRAQNTRTASTGGMLLGSDVHEASYEIGGQTITLGDVVARAHKDSGLTVEEWNDLDEDERHAKIDIALDAIADEVEAGQNDPEAEREELAKQYEAKFQRKPHPNMKIENLKAALAE